MSDSNTNVAEPVGGSGGPAEGEIRKPVTVILLSIITCGIYTLYWEWITKDQINKLADKEIIGSGLLILSWFCFPVRLFVWYKWDLGLQEIVKRFNVKYNSNFILWVILAVVAGVGYFVLLFQVQDTLNKIYGGE